MNILGYFVFNKTNIWREKIEKIAGLSDSQWKLLKKKYNLNLRSFLRDGDAPRTFWEFFDFVEVSGKKWKERKMSRFWFQYGK